MIKTDFTVFALSTLACSVFEQRITFPIEELSKPLLRINDQCITKPE
jgi:hypothetical protein